MFDISAEDKAQLIQVLKKSGSANKAEALANQHMLAQAFAPMLREVVYSGDVVLPIFEAMVLEPEASPEFPLAAIGPGDEDDHIAYCNPGHGYIPQRLIEGDYVMIPTYQLANAEGWLLKHARQGRMEIVRQAMEAFAYGFVQKINDDGWHTIIAGAIDRNILVFDADATAGQLTKRLISLAKLTMRRNGGGNSSSMNRAKLTDIFLSPEGIEDIRNWGVDQVDEVTRREIFLSADGTITRIYGVNLHDMDEFGAGHPYQVYFSEFLGASLEPSDSELAIGLDLSKRDCFIMPVKQGLEVYEDDTLFRKQEAGIFGWQEQGFACLDNRRLICLSY